MEVHSSDLVKIRDALAASEKFFLARDKSNAAVHLAASVRLSPLTSTVQAERERCDTLLQGGGK